MKFKTHLGEIIEGEQLQAALHVVADWLVSNAKAIREEDDYATHVTIETKEQNLNRQLAQAERLRLGDEPINFTLWQRINQTITGECIAFLPSNKG